MLLENILLEKIAEAFVSTIVQEGVGRVLRSSPIFREIKEKVPGELDPKNLIEAMKEDPQLAQKIIDLIKEIEIIEKPIPLTLNLKNWVGREDAIQQLKNWLNTSGITTIGIQGLGGVGKSYLVTYLYQEYQNLYQEDRQSTNNFYPLYFDFNYRRSQTFIDFAKQIMQINNLSRVVFELIGYLNQSRILLVMDNLDNILDESRNFRDKDYEIFFKYWNSYGTSSVLLLTVREKPVILEGQKYWYSLEGLKPQEAVDLLNIKLEIEGNRSELENFVRYVDGHPLTLRLVANYLQRNCHSNLNNIKNLSVEKFPLVYQKAEGIHREQNSTNLKKIIEQHFKPLTEQQKNFLFKLSVYRQPFDCRAAIYMWTKEEENVEPQLIDIQKELSELSDRSLLVKTKDRYKNQPLVQQYILQKAEDLASAHQSAINYYRQCCQSKPWQTIEDVQAYLETFYHQLQLKEYDNAFVSLKVISDFLTQCSYYNVQVEYYHHLVYAYETTEDIKNGNYATSCAYLGNAYFNLGQYEQMVEYYRKFLHSSGNEAILGKLSQLYEELKPKLSAGSIAKILEIVKGLDLDDEEEDLIYSFIYSLYLGSRLTSVMKFVQKNKLWSVLLLPPAIIVSPFALAWLICLVLFNSSAD